MTERLIVCCRNQFLPQLSKIGQQQESNSRFSPRKIEVVVFFVTVFCSVIVFGIIVFGVQRSWIVIQRRHNSGTSSHHRIMCEFIPQNFNIWPLEDFEKKLFFFIFSPFSVSHTKSGLVLRVFGLLFAIRNDCKNHRG